MNKLYHLVKIVGVRLVIVHNVDDIVNMEAHMKKKKIEKICPSKNIFWKVFIYLKILNEDTLVTDINFI